MISVFDSSYFQILIHQAQRAFEIRFKKEASSLFGENFEREIVKLIVTVEENQSQDACCPNLIINTIEGGPIMELATQRHMHSVVYPKLWDAGIRTKVYCLGNEIISKTSVELTVENTPEGQFNDRIFNSLEEGQSWLDSFALIN